VFGPRALVTKIDILDVQCKSCWLWKIICLVEYEGVSRWR